MSLRRMTAEHNFVVSHVEYAMLISLSRFSSSASSSDNFGSRTLQYQSPHLRESVATLLTLTTWTTSEGADTVSQQV